MRQTQVAVHPLLSVTVIAGLLGFAWYGHAATAGETTGLPGFTQAADQDAAVSSAGAALGTVREAVAGPAATMLTKVEAMPEGNRMTLVLTGNGVFSHTVKMIGDRRMVLDMPRIQSGVHQSQLIVGHPLLSRVRFGYHPDKVRLVLDLTQSVEHTIDSADGRLILTLAPKPGVALNESTAGEVGLTPSSDSQAERGGALEAHRSVSHLMLVGHKSPKALLHVQPIQLNAESFQKEEKKADTNNEVVNGSSRFVGRRISLDFQQADISNVLRLIAEVSGFNIVVGEGVKNKVTMKLANVPWDQALEMLLKMNALGMIRQGNIVWVDTLVNIAKQQDEEAHAKDSKAKAEPIVTRVFYIRNLNATEVQTSLRQNLSPRGTMTVSAASNALIISDTESKLDVLRQLLDGVDLEVPQVQIEARIVQADTTYTRSLGVQWGIQNVNQLGGGGVANFKTGTTGPFANQVSDFLINLPANPGLPSVPGAGFTIGKIDGALLDVRLSAGELLGLTKVIAAPKITTLDKRDAKIAQGESIPFQTTSLQGTQTTFVDANLELNVTPQITSRDPKEIGKQILMKVRATRNAVGARSNPAGPSIDRREATTQVLVRDGETMVIGGVFVDTQSNSVAGIPYLSRIPVLGWLFKSKTENVSKQELLIFMTPTIVRSTT